MRGRQFDCLFVTLTHMQSERGTVTRKRKKEKAVRMCAHRPAWSPSPGVCSVKCVWYSVCTVNFAVCE